MFLHRDFMSGLEVNEAGFSTETEADLVVRKWRNGKSNFIIPLSFDAPKMKFKERSNSPVFTSNPISSPYETKDNDDMPF